MAETDWEITATTVYCEAVGDEVTLMVYSDGTCKCTGAEKYAGADKKKKRGVKNGECSEATCRILREYRDSLLRSQ